MNNSLTVVIDNPHLLGTLCGPDDSNLREISTLLSSPVYSQGNEITIQSQNKKSRQLFRSILDRLLELAGSNDVIYEQHIRSIYYSMGSENQKDGNAFRNNVLHLPFGNYRVHPQSRTQADYIQEMKTRDLIFSEGPAGTGKTFLAIAHALIELLSRKKQKIILTRPVVETGESLGFLPGDLTQKLAPYLRPLYDAMEAFIDTRLFEQLKSNGQLEVAPLAYMRGRSFNNCTIVLDEAQNTTIEQMKMLLTRIGEGSRVIVTGDLTQIDLTQNRASGLADAIEILEHLAEVAVIRFTSEDVVRHPLVKRIVDAYENHGNKGR